MLFNSYVFLLGFLPAALLLHWMSLQYAPQWRIHVLVFLSFVFYGYWDWRFIPLLALSILINWLIVELFHSLRKPSLTVLAIAGNLLCLGVFKYTNFLTTLLNAGFGAHIQTFEIALPLGISFFTFHHIMYLTDLKAGRAPRYGLAKYALYIAFFPQILAGPLVRWNEIMHQFNEPPYRGPDTPRRVAVGLILLTFGLGKKVFIGDSLAAAVNPIFEAAARGSEIQAIDAWQATLGFTFQIYFDFSGYTDIAIGIALLLGIVLPQNFDAPYRATSLRDFWRRWHMTLSRFLRDYLYVPLGGNRNGLSIELCAILVTMALGGLWHGAGMTFLIWGVAHGSGLGIGVLWRRTGIQMPAALGWALTFVFVALCWVPFRATSFAASNRIYSGLAGAAGLGDHVDHIAWLVIALAAAIATIGPTSWTLAHQLPARQWVAISLSLIFTAVLLRIGDSANLQFIYFQF
jgi:D-alanyl-lipoteichoic acid acyltransferase DltB (MBOAT superfamily)